MRRILAIASMTSLAACGSPSPRARVARLYASLDAHDAGGVARMVVSGALARKLLECHDYEEYDRVAERARDHATRADEVQRVIKTFTGEDQATMWHTLRPGDAFGNCKVREAFSVEKYRVVLERHERFFDTQPSYPVELWHVGEDWFVASDPEID